MKRKLIIAVVALACIAAVWALVTREERRLRASVENTRREVRAQGFRTDLSDFSLADAQRATNEVRAILDAAEAAQNVRSTINLRLMRVASTNAAQLSRHTRKMDWETLRSELEPHRKVVDNACVALARGRIAFEPDLSGRMRVPHAAAYKRLAQVLSARAALAIHDGRDAEAVSNVVALSRMVTRWEPESVEISHLVRFTCLDVAHNTLWESMHSVRWTEEQLAALQREWESARLWQGLPETAELTCANMVHHCRAARTDTNTSVDWKLLLKECFSSPKSGFQNLGKSLQQRRVESRYRKEGSYEDEGKLLIYYRDRKAELQRAVAASTWEQMRSFPGVTNYVVFRGATNSRITAMMNLKFMGMSMQANGRSFMGRAVESEARRGIIVTALALQRFKLAQGKYPNALRDLVPTYLNSVPPDVINGQELRYRIHEGGGFVLYSIGLDGLDNGGTAVVQEQFGESWRNERAPVFRRIGIDVVWPRLATAEEQEQWEKDEPSGERTSTIERSPDRSRQGVVR